MNTALKMAVEVAVELMEGAQQASGTGVTQTVRAGLQLIAASENYTRLRALPGKTPVLACRGRTEDRPVIAAGTSTWIAFLQGERGADTDLLDKALADRSVAMIPVLLTELLSDPKLAADIGRTLLLGAGPALSSNSHHSIQGDPVG